MLKLEMSAKDHGVLPSSRLLRAAMSGLLLGAGACADDEGNALESAEAEAHDSELSDSEIDALCKEKVESAVDDAKGEQDVQALCSEMVEDAKKETQAEVDLSKQCEELVSDARSELEASVSELQAKVKKLEEQATAKDNELSALKEKARPLLLTSDEKTISAEQKEYTYAELTKRCDERGGYTQIHAACGGHNACAGFSYGDWGPGAAMLTEHSCTGVNGCLGLSCVDLPKDGGRSGKELYEDHEFPEPLNNCGGCHGGYYDADDKWTHDNAYFAVYVLKDSTRTADNWLDRSAREQELVTAFGARSILPGGTAIQNMAAYHGSLSRAETERVVAHIRTLKPYIRVTKTADPQVASE
jgi:mono/diheme cytochrome c family protein